MGAQKSDCQKMGAAHFFFLRSPFSQQKKLWAGRPSCAHYFFFATPIFSTKKIWATFLLNLYFFLHGNNNLCLSNYLRWNFLKLWAKRPFSAHFFFFLKRPFSQKKNSGRCAHHAPTSFFFPPMTLISLLMTFD